MVKRSEPRFELLPQRAKPMVVAAFLCAALLVACLLPTVAWTWLEAHRAAVRLDAARLAVRDEVALGASAQIVAMPTQESVVAARLLQSPLGDWFAEMEACQPDAAKTRALRFDGMQRRLTFEADLLDEALVEEWGRCLNAGQPESVWRLERITAPSSVQGGRDVPAIWSVAFARSL